MHTERKNTLSETERLQLARQAFADYYVATLEANGFAIEWILRQPAYLRAIAAKEGQSLRLKWAQDSAFRFFPVEQDELCGYRLHRADAATNKVLALRCNDILGPCAELGLMSVDYSNP